VVGPTVLATAAEFDQVGILRAATPQGDGFPAANLAVWHFSTTGGWAPRGDPDAQVHALAGPDADGYVVGRALAVGADGLWVGGSFTSAGQVPSNNLARWCDDVDAEPGPAGDPGTDGHRAQIPREAR
jgi:hypothetical protein